MNWIKDSVAGTSTTPQKQEFKYDELDRLVSASASAGSIPEGEPGYDAGYASTDHPEAYVYDPVTGNLSDKANLKLHYDNSDHAHAVTSTTKIVAGTDPTYTYTYDLNGNMLTRQTAADKSTMTYDAEGHLVTVSGPGSYRATFVYRCNGKSSSKMGSKASKNYSGEFWLSAPPRNKKTNQLDKTSLARL